MSETPGSRVGSMFGPYQLKRPLGRGGMGEVYEAEHTVKGWTVAVKLMSETVSKDPVFRERMKREARIAGRLQEPHVVPIHDYGEIDGQMFLEMRLIEGMDLDSILTRYGPLPPPRAVAVISQIAKALDAAHAVAVMHRDVKPPNILVTHNDFAYLVDFGIASAKTEEKLTQMGEAVGTWKYMAPERFTNAELTRRADVYSLACVLYECLTGTAPYSSDSAGVLISAHMMEPIPKPSEAREGVPKALDAVIARGMAKNPEDRYHSAGELARAAQKALSEPDRDQVANIVRRSQEAELPAQFREMRTVQHPPTPHHGPPGSPPRPPAPQPRRPGQGPSDPVLRPGPSAPPGPGPSGPIPRPRPPSVPARPTGYQAWAPGSGPNPRPGPPAWNDMPPSGPPPQAFAGPIPFAPGYRPPRRRNPWPIVAAVAAAVLVIILGVVGIRAATEENDSQLDGQRTTTTTRTTTPTTTTPPSTTTVSPDAQARLMSLLPPGYPAGTCNPDAQPMPGATVSVTCGQNTDVNGPRAAAYGLYADAESLKNAFTGFIGTFTIQSCPGGKASPGTWWHNQDPTTILGQVACGMYKGADPQVMWSNEQTLLFALVSGKPQGPDLDQVYKWWASHS